MQRSSTINRSAVEAVPFPARRSAPAVSLTRLAWRRRVAKASRWLHIYGSMGSLALVLFFAITGITLNHQEWFAGQQVSSERHGTMSPSWLRTTGPQGVDALRVVEYLRSDARLRGALSEVRVDDGQAELVFKGPGYEASVVVDRTTGKFDVNESRMGLAAVINDLHKGRDTGAVWKAVVDVSAALLVFIAITGLVLLYFVHKYRLAGIILFGAGGLLTYLAYVVWVP
jgi:hypothetical protein